MGLFNSQNNNLIEYKYMYININIIFTYVHTALLIVRVALLNVEIDSLPNPVGILSASVFKYLVIVYHNI